MAGVDSTAFRAVFGRVATGVLVLTTNSPGGSPHGVTVNAVTSVSLEPVLILVCLQRGTTTQRFVCDNGSFALSVLPRERADLAAHFADRGRPPGAAQFAGVETRPVATGSLVLDCCLAWVDCEVWATHDAGDHVIVVGEVTDLGLGHDDASPLLFYESGYHTVDDS